MQIKLTDGTIHDVPQSQIERLYKLIPNKVHLDEDQDDAWLQNIMQAMHDKAEHCMHEQAKVIKHTANLEHCPQTCEEVRDALTEVLMYGPDWDISEMIMHIAGWVSARKAMHILHKGLETL